MLNELSFPLIQAPMAGGADTAELVVAVSQAGCLGSIGAAYLSADAIHARVRQVRALTTCPFAINLFIPAREPICVSESSWQRMLELTRPYRVALELPDPPIPAVFAEDFTAQMQAVLDLAPRVFSFCFGIPSADILRSCRERGIFTIGTATTVEEGILLRDSGVDCVCAQGIEAGGHRGSFAIDADTNTALDTLSLIGALRSKLSLPLIAAGGIMDGRGIAAALARGADAVALGTAFLACTEAGTSAPYKEALLQTTRPTVLTRAFSGRIARGLANTFTHEMAAHTAELLPFPAQNTLTRDIRTRAAMRGNAELLSLWAGQGVKQIRAMSARELIDSLRSETTAINVK